MERWLPVARNENYEVSSLGNVRRCRGYNSTRVGRPLKPFPHKDGHLLVKLSKGGYSTNAFVHQLVCEAFHGPRPSPKHEVAHGDGCDTNNEEGNLRWATRRENSADMIAHGRSKYGSANGNSKLTEETVRAIRKMIAENRTDTAIAECSSISRSSVRNIRTGATWSKVQ